MWHHVQNYNINQIYADTIHAFSMIKYHKYPSILILKHVNVLAEVIRLRGVYLYQITLYKKYTILKSKYAQWTDWNLVASKRFQIPVYNYQGHLVTNTTTLNIQTLMSCSNNNGNIIHIKMYAKVGKTERKFTDINTI